MKKFSWPIGIFLGLCTLSAALPRLAHAQQSVSNAPPPPPLASASSSAATMPNLLNQTPPASTPNPGPPAAPSLPGDTAGGPALPGGGVESPIPNFFGGNNSAPATGGLTPEPGLEAAGGQGNYNFQKSQEELDEEVRTDAFNAALDGILPLRPEEIRKLLEKFDRTQESVEVPVYPAPKPEVAVETLSLDPGTPPATIHTAYGHVTTLTILDQSGAPWPIEDISWAGNFEVIETSSSQGSHIVRISPQSEFATGNMSIRLLTLKTPVIISLDTSRDIVHYRFDAVIPDYGPMAEAPLIDTGIQTVAGDNDISTVLQGIIPKGAVKMDVSGVDGRTSAYKLKGKAYVRTPLTLLSPSWNGSVASADGMRVYALSQDAPVLLLSDKGRMVRARLAPHEDILKELVKGDSSAQPASKKGTLHE